MAAPPPYDAIVNSNALGVGYISCADNCVITFLSRHAVRRLGELDLLGRSAESLIGAPASELAEHRLLTPAALGEPHNYPATVQVVVGGRSIELALSAVAALDGTHLGVMMTFRDRTSDVEREASSAEFRDTMTSLVARARGQGETATKATGGLTGFIDSVQTIEGETTKLVAEILRLNQETKILSFNASIEAHRSSSAGAFTVIADEMRQLSNQMATVTEEIKNLLDGIAAQSAQAQEFGERITSSVREIIDTQESMENTVRTETQQ